MEGILGFVKKNSIDTKDQKTLEGKWRLASQRWKELQATEAGIADGPSIKGLPTSLEPLKEKVLADPYYHKAYDGVDHRLAMIGLERLIVFQRYMDLTFVDVVRSGLGPRPEPEEVFRVTLPFDHPRPSFTVEPASEGTYYVYSPSTDLRFLDVQVLGPERSTVYSSPGPIGGILALVFGFGCNFMTALHIGNRLILNNGSHRALALLELGVKEVPCIVHDVRDLEELKKEGSGDLAARPKGYLDAPRPPLLKDYLDPALTQVIRTRRRVRRIRVDYDVEPGNIVG